MTNKEAIEILSMELHHVETHLKIEGKDAEYYVEMSEIAEALRYAIRTLKTMSEADEKPTKYMCDKCGNVTLHRFMFCPKCDADSTHCC